MSARLPVRVTPRSSQTKLRCEDGLVQAWVTAAPTDGQANEAVCRLVADRLGVAPSRVAVWRGDTSRQKVLQIEGLTLDEALARLVEAK